MIVVDRVAKSYGRFKALKEVSFELWEGESAVILGPSGSGKTTLLRLIAGLEIPDGGEIYLNGRLASRRGWALPPHLRGIGFVFQTSALWPHMTVAQNILFGLHRLKREDARARLQELLDQTGLTEVAGCYPDQISGGQARRAALARSLAPRPRYLLMDEPLTNLDAETKQKMLELIKKTAGGPAISLVYVTHDAWEAEQIGGKILVLERGRLKNGAP